MFPCLRRFGSRPAQGWRDSNQEQTLAILRHGQSALRKLRWRIGAFWIGLTAILSVCFFLTRLRGEFFERHPQYTSAWYWVALNALFSEFLFDARLVFPILAPLDDDIGFLRCVLVFEAAYLAFLRTRMLLFLCTDDTDGWQGLSAMSVVYQILFLVRGYAFVAFAIWGLARWRNPQLMQRGLRLAVIQFLLINALAAICQLGVSIQTGEYKECCLDWAVNLCAAYMLLRPQALQSLQAKLRHWMETRGATRAAAAIACLIGSADPKIVFQQAQQRFRSVDISQLTFDDLKDNTPDPRLNAVAESTKLGHCDAFVSHSWHDDASAKWEALQRWRCSFRAKHGRDPRVWFDKVCIDQTNIEADLRCLPISLSGCNSLLVLCGPTYLSRLWCIIEIFTFIIVGGSIENIDVRLVLREEPERDDMRVLVSAFEGFDVADCQCYNQSDKARILFIIGTAFGALSAFNEVVTDLLVQIQRESPTMARMSQAVLLDNP